ncbi:hypothetical protein AV530_020031 [Patagioenas fasciata monilis]|uniref:Uncharacterized protein n=1 Tax=Patagioenas fasciata monilis TaxID=372326 RepID=A0A1V4JHT1_PATFA|nr:hypothetical protein AV530_020031 [Patagioenas fasciata monilis]
MLLGQHPHSLSPSEYPHAAYPQTIDVNQRNSDSMPTGGDVHWHEDEDGKRRVFFRAADVPWGGDSSPEAQVSLPTQLECILTLNSRKARLRQCR